MDRYQLERVAEAGHKAFVEDYTRAQRSDMPQMAVPYTQLPATVQEFYALLAERVAAEVEKQPVQDMTQLARLAHQAFLEDHFEKLRRASAEAKPMQRSPWAVAWEQLPGPQQNFYAVISRAMATQCGQQMQETSSGAWATSPW